MHKVYDRPVLVTGATGKQGGAVCHALQSHGHRVRALTRDPDKPAAQRLAQEGIEVVPGDLEDPATLRPALADAAALFSVQDFAEAGVEGELRQGHNLLRAAAEADLEHIVYSGATAADRGTGVPHLESKWQLELALRALPVRWTVFRPVAFMENWYWTRPVIDDEGILPLPATAQSVYQQISVRDIAAMVAQALAQPDFWGGRATALAASALTPDAVAAVFSRVLGREIRWVPVPWDTCLEQLGPDLTSMYRYFDAYGMDGDPVQLRRWHPDALDLEDWLRLEGWGAA